MNSAKPFTTFAAVIFLLIALAHLYRLFSHFQIVLGSHPVPEWFSMVGVVVGGLISAMLFREARR